MIWFVWDGKPPDDRDLPPLGGCAPLLPLPLPLPLPGAIILICCNISLNVRQEKPPAKSLCVQQVIKDKEVERGRGCNGYQPYGSNDQPYGSNDLPMPMATMTLNRLARFCH